MHDEIGNDIISIVCHVTPKRPPKSFAAKLVILSFKLAPAPCVLLKTIHNVHSIQLKVSVPQLARYMNRKILQSRIILVGEVGHPLTSYPQVSKVRGEHTQDASDLRTLNHS